ncbi:MAG: nuclear transport factor 2 family protein [Neomegalonema sp.]|nr:nuclear transport factor 2 family protein [Neomegalonema sp.]
MTSTVAEQTASILAVMQVYFDGLYHSDSHRLRQALHPQARYVCPTEMPMIQLDLDAYLKIIDTREAPSARGEERQDQIVSIEFAGPSAAFVRAHCAVGERWFTDLLTLVRDQGRWMIISKVFHYDLTTPANEQK